MGTQKSRYEQVSEYMTSFDYLIKYNPLSILKYRKGVKVRKIELFEDANDTGDGIFHAKLGTTWVHWQQFYLSEVTAINKCLYSDHTKLLSQR